MTTPRRRRPTGQQQQEVAEEQPALDTSVVEEIAAEDTSSVTDVEHQEEGGTTVVNRNTTSEVFSQLLERMRPRERGLLSPEQTEQERAAEQRLQLISSLLMEEEHLLSVLQLMRPDMLKEAFDLIGDAGRELQQMAYLEWLHGTFQMLAQVAKLTQYTIEIHKKSLKDAGIDLGPVDQQAVPYTALTAVFQRLGERLAQRAQGIG
jgi:hypothetical protein